MQIAVRVRTDPPLIHPAAVRNGFHVHEAFVRVPWRLAVEKEAGNHAPAFAQSMLPARILSKLIAFASMFCGAAIVRV